MKWFKSSKKEEEDEDNARALVKQDPRTNVKTTTAQSETTNTTTQNSTIFNNNKNTVTYQSTKQTVTSRQTARITEITSRRTPTLEEFDEMMRLLHLNKKPETKTFSSTTTTSSAPLRRNRPGNLPALPSSQRNSQNGISPKSATKFKNTVSPISRLIFNYESSAQGAGSAGEGSKTPKTPTIVKTSTTTVTEKNGRTVTQRVEEHRVKFDAKNFKLSTPNSPLTKNFTGAEDSYKFDARPSLPALPAPSRLSSSSIGSNSSTTSFNKPSSISTKPTSTFASTYTSPYKQRELNRVPNTTTTFSTTTTKPLYNTKTTTTYSKPNTSSIFTTTTKPNSIFSLSTPKTTATTYTSNISKPTPLFTSSSSTKPTVITKPTTTTTTSLKTATPTLVAGGKTVTAPLGKPGYAYIFNNVVFDNPNNEERIGSAEDVKALVQTFEYYKMKVTVIENAKVEKIRKTVEKIQSKDFKENACLVIVILSHGARHEEIAAKDGHYSIDDHILFPILRNPTLNDKPKLFFIQACKGSMETNGYYTDAVPFNPLGSANEILKCYSTFEGFVSYRTEKGSMFIQALCQNLKLFGSTKNIKDIMELVTQIVKQQSQNKQIPAYTSTLTKPFIFGDYVKRPK
ncbi:mucin-2-like [Calliphora vicina]|uniref:mucin-2-like n=1 Tax=Calliphora vicina TaxID=7373 RepID=UPI00325B8706